MKLKNKENKLTVNKKKIFTVLSVLAFIIFSFIVTYFIGKPLINFVSEPEKFRAWVDSHGFFSRIAFIGMIAFQVIIALVPGEPFEIGAGYAFGAVEGTLLCVIGITIGSIVVFSLVKKFGVKIVEVFFPIEKIQSLKFLQNEKRLNVITFILFFIPGTPKDLLSYFVGLTDIKISRWILIASIARLPSIITSTAGGSALGVKNYEFAIIVFTVTLIVSGLGLLIYRKICKIHNDKK